MTRDEFESTALQRLQDLYPRARFLKAGQLEIAIVRTPSGRPASHRLRLARAWAAFCQNGSGFDLDGYLSRVIRTIEHRVPPDWATARRMIFPRLVTRDSLPQTPQTPLFYPLTGELGYLLICEEYDVCLTEQQLESWQCAEECALAAAMDNLSRLWQAATIVALTVQDVVRAFHVEVAHGHKAAFVLLPQFYERATELLNTTQVFVAMPNRNFLVAFSAEDEDFREILQPILRKELNTGLPLTGSLLLIDQDGYEESTLIL